MRGINTIKSSCKSRTDTQERAEVKRDLAKAVSVAAWEAWRTGGVDGWAAWRGCGAKLPTPFEAKLVVRVMLKIPPPGEVLLKARSYEKGSRTKVLVRDKFEEDILPMLHRLAACEKVVPLAAVGALSPPCHPFTDHRSADWPLSLDDLRQRNEQLYHAVNGKSSTISGLLQDLETEKPYERYSVCCVVCASEPAMAGCAARWCKGCYWLCQGTVDLTGHDELCSKVHDATALFKQAAAPAAASIVPGLRVRLRDYQAEAVNWMVAGEESARGLPSQLYAEVKTADGTPTYLSPALHRWSTSPPPVVKGGFLAEEMGLVCHLRALYPPSFIPCAYTTNAFHCVL